MYNFSIGDTYTSLETALVFYVFNFGQLWKEGIKKSLELVGLKIENVLNRDRYIVHNYLSLPTLYLQITVISSDIAIPNKYPKIVGIASIAKANRPKEDREIDINAYNMFIILI